MQNRFWPLVLALSVNCKNIVASGATVNGYFVKNCGPVKTGSSQTDPRQPIGNLPDSPLRFRSLLYGKCPRQRRSGVFTDPVVECARFLHPSKAALP
jgi:hypothetical protein